MKRKNSLLLLCLLPALIWGRALLAADQAGFIPVGNEANPSGPQSITIRMVLNEEKAFILEGRLLGEELALPVLGLLGRIGLRHETANDCVRLTNPVTGKTVVLSFKENLLTVDGRKKEATGWFGESDYFLALADWSLLIGAEPQWVPDLQEIRLTLSWPGENGNREAAGPEPVPAVRADLGPFQPVNQLDIYVSGRADGSSFGSGPDWDYGDLNFDWKTHGLVWGGQLILGGESDWRFEPDNGWNPRLTDYRWSRDAGWGRFSLGTQVLHFWGAIPADWEMRGVSLTDRKQWIPDECVTNIAGRSDAGDRAELWLDGSLIASTAIQGGRFCFDSIWLPQLQPCSLVIVIKQGDRIVERRTVDYISGERLLAETEQRYIIAFGETKEPDGFDYTGKAGALEWICGLTEDLTLGGSLTTLEQNGRTTQGGLNMAWRPRKNLIFRAENWAEGSDLAWHLNTDWGFKSLYLQTGYFHRDYGFKPIFPCDETESELDLGQFGFNWYPADNWKGIIAAEHRKERASGREERLKLESSLDFRNGNWWGMGYAEWQDTDSTVIEGATQSRLAFSLGWDFLPNQWLEGGTDWSHTRYELSGDETTVESWLRWTDQSRPRDRWFVEYGVYNGDKEDKERVKTQWNHLWSGEWFAYTGVSYEWGEDLCRFNRWALNCGLQVQLVNGFNLGFGYEWSVRRPELGPDEYQQGISLWINFGVLFGSGGPTIVPGSADEQTTGVVTGVVYRDLNNNGVRDRGEQGVSGVRVQLDNLATVITDAEGRFAFFNVATGIHRIEIDPATLSVLYNPVERPNSIYVVAGASLKVDLGLKVVAGVSGQVFLDADGNGVRDGEEAVLSGVRVVADDGVWATTGQDGEYYIQLTAGKHTLRIDPATLPSGMTPEGAKEVVVGETGEETTGIDLAVKSES